MNNQDPALQIASQKIYEPVLFIAAHPDDETLGCGGTMAKYASLGIPVHVLVMSYHTTARIGFTENKTEQIRKAMSMLGDIEITIKGFPDNIFDTVSMLSIAQAIEETVNYVRPGGVFTHHIGDLNIDHRLVAQATMIATRPTPGQCVKTVLSYEVPSSTEWGFGQIKNFTPNVFIDIDGFVDQKIEALQVYENEMRDFPHPRSPEVIRAHATQWGSVAGSRACEAFELVRSIC